MDRRGDRGDRSRDYDSRGRHVTDDRGGRMYSSRDESYDRRDRSSNRSYDRNYDRGRGYSNKPPAPKVRNDSNSNLVCPSSY